MPPFPQPHMMNPSFLIIELLYATIIIAICLIIYAKTKELYTLSHHKGIRHFREAFLFFALAYFFRLIPALFKLTDLHMHGHRIGFIAGFFLFSYASAMAIMSIARSVTWKKIPKGPLKEDTLYHLLAIILAIIVLFTNSIFIFFLLQATLIILVFFLTQFFHQQRKKRSKSYYTYLLLLLFWMMNIALLSIPRFIRSLTNTLYLVSLAIFLVVLFRVIGRTRR